MFDTLVFRLTTRQVVDFTYCEMVRQIMKIERKFWTGKGRGHVDNLQVHYFVYVLIGS